MTAPKITSVRAHTVRGGGADYMDQEGYHWIDDHIATPMAIYPEYRESRRSFGINVLGTVVVEIEADTGVTGFALTTGGALAAWIVEHHLARLLEGQPVTDLERMWDQMYRSTLFYGRRGIVLNTISGVDLAIWDLLGRVRQEPVYALLGGLVRSEQPCYATGPRPDLAEKWGFIGGKFPLQHGLSEGLPGIRKTVSRMAALRDAVSDDFWLMIDCWMSLDVPFAARLARELDAYDLRWIEEALLPDDYWAYAELRRQLPPGVSSATGEHEATRWGFRHLVEMGAADILQPDIGWCGGMTELLKIGAYADTHGIPVIPHGSSVYSYHFVMSSLNSPFAEFIMMHPTGEEIIPMFSPMLENEPIPEGGLIRLSDAPGFGVELNSHLNYHRPYTH